MAMLDIFGSGMLNAAEDMIRKKKATDGRTNPNSRPTKQGKNAKSSKAGKRAADRALQQQMQADQFKFLQENIFDRTGATRRDISGQIERNVPKGMDYFKNTGPDRPELVDRQNRLNNQGLKNPWFEANAREAVDLARRKQSEPSLFGTPQQPSLDQLLRQNTSTMDVFDNPANNQTNPRTGLVTNDGPFVRSRPNPYGTARAEFSGVPQGSTSVGPVQQLFTAQPQTQQPDWSQNFMQYFSQLPQQTTQPQQQAQQPSADAFNIFGAPNFSWGQLGEAFNFNNPEAWINDPFNRVK